MRSGGRHLIPFRLAGFCGFTAIAFEVNIRASKGIAMISKTEFLTATATAPMPLDLYADGALLSVSAPAPAHMTSHALNTALTNAFPDLERRVDILLEGTFNDGEWLASCGHFVGRFDQPLWGIAASGKPQWLRYGCFDRIESGRIVESYMILDIARLLTDTGQWPLAPQLGQDWFPAPQTQDGTQSGHDGSAESLKLVEAMIGGLMQYDRQSLASMGMTRFWTPQFHWYGPGGIGSARGHKDYERAHQGPFLAAFPDRVGGNHKCRIGDGAYVASTGWPSIKATHMGDSWLGLPATNKPVTMRVMDFWRRDEAMLVENWVFIDMIDLLSQIGVDVMARIAALKGVPQ
jgi:predicted ester cyclase